MNRRNRKSSAQLLWHLLGQGVFNPIQAVALKIGSGQADTVDFIFLS